MYVYTLLAAVLLVADPATAIPRHKTIATINHHHSFMFNNEKVTSDNHHINTYSNEHVIKKRKQSDTTSTCQFETKNLRMVAPILQIKIDNKDFLLSYGEPEKPSYPVCVFKGCSEQQILQFKQNNKPGEATFHYDGFTESLDGQPVFKIAYTKFFTQCEAEQPSKSTTESEEDK